MLPQPMFILGEIRRSSRNETNSKNRPWLYVASNTYKAWVHNPINEAKVSIKNQPLVSENL